MFRHRPLLTFALVLIALVLIVRLIWGWHVDRLVRAELALIRERGEPVTVDDIVLEPVPDSENAWLLQQQAATLAMASGVDSPKSSAAIYQDYPPFSDPWMQVAAASAQAHGQVFALARQARQRPRAQIATTIPASMSQLRLAYLNDARQLCNLLADDMIYQHVQGNDSEALERVLDVMHVADSLHSDPQLLSQLVGIGIDALGQTSLQTIAPGLDLHRRGEGETPARQRAREVIDRLLDEHQIIAGFHQSLLAERPMGVSFTRELAKGTWMIRPLAELEVVRQLRQIKWNIEAATLPNQPAVLALLAKRPQANFVPPVMIGQPLSTGPRYAQVWFSLYRSTYDRSHETLFRMLADRRMTAVSLAIQLYRADHGDWPASLDQLVPDYLSAIPADPFPADGAPIGYEILADARPDGLPRPMLYVDHGDAEDTLRPEPMFGWQGDTRSGRDRRDNFRQYRDISRWMPATLRKESWPQLSPEQSGGDGSDDLPSWLLERLPNEDAEPSTQAVGGDPEEADAPGDQAEPDDGGEEPQGQ